MESAGERFDVVAVVSRAVGLDLSAASQGELAWADRAGDRIRAWVDAWQAQVHFEQTLPRPLPDVDLPSPGGPDPSAAGGSEAADLSATPTSESVGNAPPPDEPLPSLGSAPQPLESVAERERKARRAWLLSALPAFAEALREGRTTTAHVDLLAAAADELPPPIRDRVIAQGDELLLAACGLSPERFSRQVQRAIATAYDREGIERAAAQRARSGLRRGVDDATKMHWIRVDLDPERGAPLFARLDAEREAIFHSGNATGLTREHVELQALLNLCAPTITRTAPMAERAQRSSTKKIYGLVLIDVTTWLDGAHQRTICENAAGVPLPPDTVRRLMCQAELTYGLLINGRVVASIANNDLATADQRHELRMMYRTCAGPDCDRPFDRCQIHHIIARSRHGPTDVALMVPLCTRHHDAIHHHGWTLAIDTDRTLTWTQPNGQAQVCPLVPLAELDQPTLFPADTARPPPAA